MRFVVGDRDRAERVILAVGLTALLTGDRLGCRDEFTGAIARALHGSDDVGPDGRHGGGLVCLGGSVASTVMRALAASSQSDHAGHSGGNAHSAHSYTSLFRVVTFFPRLHTAVAV